MIRGPAAAVRTVTEPGSVRLPEASEARRLRGNNTRQGSTHKGILKPAGFLFLGFANRAGTGSPR